MGDMNFVVLLMRMDVLVEGIISEGLTRIHIFYIILVYIFYVIRDEWYIVKYKLRAKSNRAFWVGFIVIIVEITTKTARVNLCFSARD